MDRDLLERYFEEGLTLREIGEREGLDRSTIGKHAKQLGLVPPRRAKYSEKPIDVETLRSLVEHGTVAELAEHFGVSPTTIRKHLAKHGLRTAASARLRQGRLARDSQERYRELTCIRHGTTRFQLEGRGYYRCLQCRAEAVMRRRRKVRQILVEEAGGACQLCGYDRCIRALHFHHRDPGSKSFGLSQRGWTKGIAALRAEARKCVLLCSNCHAEVEDGVTQLRLPQLGSAG